MHPINMTDEQFTEWVKNLNKKAINGTQTDAEWTKTMNDTAKRFGA